jgi:3',5'-cyclic AMP phosphodiesterase CpdA
MVRLAHFSDIHISASPLGSRPGDWFSKRATSWLNLSFGRRARFDHADGVLGRLVEELPARAIDHIVFSGDATALGLDAEFRRAAEILRIHEGWMTGIAVPGNHDYLTPAAAASGRFERYFAAWQDGVRIGSHPYPFAHRTGPVWLVGVNAATGNRLPWDATGTVGPAQRERLRLLLTRLDPGPRVLVIHYPVRLANGASEHRYHALRDLAEVLAIAKAGGVRLWLHGHRHHPYVIDQPAWAPFPAICAGSGTQEGIWSYNEYAVDPTGLRATRRVFDPQRRSFHDVETFALQFTDRAPLAG